MRSYDLIDLFAGCGGMSLGFESTGRFESVFAVEFEPDAADTYEMNFGHHVARDTDGTPSQIQDVSVFPKADVVIGGPPCQGFSPLNMRAVGLGRRDLWREYLRALKEQTHSPSSWRTCPSCSGRPSTSASRRRPSETGFRR